MIRNLVWTFGITMFTYSLGTKEYTHWEMFKKYRFCNTLVHFALPQKKLYAILVQQKIMRIIQIFKYKYTKI